LRLQNLLAQLLPLHLPVNLQPSSPFLQEIFLELGNKIQKYAAFEPGMIKLFESEDIW
jgi:hypothetical protein